MTPAPLTKPTIVVVPGAWHEPGHYKYLTKQLEQASYKVFVVKLPSVGVLPAPLENGLESDAIAIRATTQPILDKGTDVVLVMHSYGGVVGSEAVFMLKKASKGKILRLVYISALIPQIGTSCSAAGSPHQPGEFEVVDNHLHYIRKPIALCFHDVSKERIDEAVALFGPVQISSVTTPVTHAAWKEEGIPVTYIACKQDCLVPFSFQEKFIKMIQASNSEVESVTMDYGHSPFLVDERRLADIIRKAASENL